MNTFEKIICFIGGANIKILQKCPSEKYKFFRTGIAILNSSLLSVFTMGYAMYAVTNNLNWLIILFSFFWGFIMFGIDWGLISTIHKRKNYDFKSGFRFFLTSVFRLIVAVVLSFTVSKPLEVLVFKDYLPVARREMQVNFEEKLNYSFVSNENVVRSALDSVETAITGLVDQRQRAYEDDLIVRRLMEERNTLLTAYSNRLSQYRGLNAESNRLINVAQNAINTIQNNIDQIRNSSAELPEQQRQQILSLENSKTPHRTTINAETRARNERNATLSALNSELVAKQQELDDRYSTLDTEFAENRMILREQRERLMALTDSISDIASTERVKNQEAARVFDLDILINNIIAISHLEKKKNDPNADIGEQEIAKTVRIVRRLLIIVIILIETAAIVIKLLSKRGSYEDEREKVEKENELKCQADLKNYHNYADVVSQLESKIRELKAQNEIIIEESKFQSETEQIRQNILRKSREEFNFILSKMIEKSAEDIQENKKLWQNIAQANNLQIEDIYSECLNKSIEQLKLTIDKMYEIHGNFINEVKT